MLEEIILPRQDVLDARPSRLDNQRRCDSAARRHAAEVECFLDVVGVAVPCAKADHIQKALDRKSTRLNSSHGYISYAVFCLKKKKKQRHVIRVIIYLLHT